MRSDDILRVWKMTLIGTMDGLRPYGSFCWEVVVWGTELWGGAHMRELRVRANQRELEMAGFTDVLAPLLYYRHKA